MAGFEVTTEEFQSVMGFFCDHCRFTGDDHNLAIWAVLVQPGRELKAILDPAHNSRAQAA
jgi:hypothetical protein